MGLLGRQSDGDGNLINWWDEDTVKAYVSRAECFVSQYSSYVAEEVNVTVNVTYLYAHQLIIS